MLVLSPGLPIKKIIVILIVRFSFIVIASLHLAVYGLDLLSFPSLMEGGFLFREGVYELDLLSLLPGLREGSYPFREGVYEFTSWTCSPCPI